MAGPFDPFTPGQSGDPTAGVDPNTFNRVRSEWDAFLSDPAGRGALLSMGLAMMQPPSFGDTPTAQIGRAVGAGGESARIADTQELKRRELESKEELRGARAEAAIGNMESRAIAAEARKGAAGERLGFQAERLRMQQNLGMLQRRIQASNAYQNYVKAHESQRFLNPSLPPALSAPDFYKQRGFGDLLSGTGGATTEDDDVEVPATAQTTSAPPAPAVADRKANTIYSTPKGPLRWTGTGWVNP